ncbi:lipase class 3 family protein [Vararia minispora EC-137]|uniref:Lipase class 3 family protein n=1 Tax=Vararia minispora EC-137 TaxID=1314806 RepID=A0ACB8QSI5_9AGAM|nr:lipase class 3 family protein [Vararia minispora EC-137]
MTIRTNCLVLCLATLLLVSAPWSVAVPSSGSALARGQSFPILTQDQIATFRPYTLFASAAYCNPSITGTWTCGANCDANPGFQPTASGGNDGTVQYWYVGYDPTLDKVIVAHQGTDSDNLTADLTDVEITMDPLDPTLFPGLSSTVHVHTGFRDAHARTATTILSEVQTALSQHSTQEVVITGHSLGAALSLLDAIYLSLHLPSNIKISTIGYGLPRVGDAAFANYVDAHVDLTHITNKHDPFPILPFQFLGFRQPSNEVHIDQNNNWVQCPGQENDSTECIDGAVPFFWEGTPGDHEGPYDGIVMGLGQC